MSKAHTEQKEAIKADPKENHTPDVEEHSILVEVTPKTMTKIHDEVYLEDGEWNDEEE